MLKLSFVIPCYGSELTIESVISEIIDIVSRESHYNYEIICVNDCSPDNLLSKLKKMVRDNHNIIVVDLTKNMGKHSAMMAGYSVASGDYIVNLDDDGQCPLDKLWTLIDALKNGNDIAMANYPVKKQSRFKNFGSGVNALMSSILLDRPEGVYFSNFSVIKRFIAKEILRYQNPYPYMEGLFLRSTSRIANIMMDERERFAGKGNYTFGKSFSLWLNGFTAFSVKPLRIASLVGVIISAGGFLYGLTVVIRKLINNNVPVGYASTMAALLFIGGIIMLMLGLLGEYVGRIYICINNSPQYVIRNIINQENINENN
jgi:undecaprenyl-phosphate 4-deoxy-4-formamido-L-arabinose transferase